MERIFADTEVCLDLLARREPFYHAAAMLFSLADHKEIKIAVSSLSFSNLNYLLTKQYNLTECRRILTSFKVLVEVLPVDNKVIELALSSRFTDFEDAIQYYTALQAGIDILLTRNIKDYKLADIAVMTSEDYLKSM